MGQLGKTIATTGKAVQWYADSLIKGIDAAHFAQRPAGANGEIDTNHPAFIFGHLALYPSWLLGMLGVEPGPAAVPESYKELFGHGSTCAPDPGCTIYPPMSELMAAFNEGYTYLCGILAETDDATFAKPNALDSMKDFFPTMGDLVDFMVGAHAMGHLGQLSAWRRCMGLGSAM